MTKYDTYRIAASDIKHWATTITPLGQLIIMQRSLETIMPSWRAYKIFYTLTHHNESWVALELMAFSYVQINSVLIGLIQGLSFTIFKITASVTYYNQIFAFRLV